ncbi:MAG TPA: bile acid:sodium symporter [Streptosporangiaceae bacterium]
MRDGHLIPSRVRLLLAGYPELAAVLAAAAIGLTARAPLVWLVARQGINLFLAILVFATALTIEPAALRQAAAAWRPLLAVLAAGITALPALSWAASRLVPTGSLRDGVMAIGLAPCEIASVATTAMAGGRAAVAAGVLIGSTTLAVAVAGPLLAIEAGHSGHVSVHPGHIIASLALVVAIPMTAGIGLRARFHLAGATERAASVTVIAAVAVLVALIAAEVRLSARYLDVALALVGFGIGSALVGWLLGRWTDRPVRIAVLLTTSMRDFAIAAGLAAAAFGPAAAAPLGLYGILVLAWGTAAAGRFRIAGRRPLPQGST